MLVLGTKSCAVDGEAVPCASRPGRVCLGGRRCDGSPEGVAWCLARWMEKLAVRVWGGDDGSQEGVGERSIGIRACSFWAM